MMLAKTCRAKRLGAFGVRPAVLTALLAAVLAATGCDNSPYPASDDDKSVHYADFSEEPKHLDPARAYSTWDAKVLGQSLEPPLQYNYLKRPYELEPLTAAAMPEAYTRMVTFRRKTPETKPAATQAAATRPATSKPADDGPIEATVYTVTLKPGTMFQNHACFVEANRRLTEADMQDVSSVHDITPTATRELTAGDYVNAVRRLADPRLDCPIYTTLESNLLGMAEYREHLEASLEAQRKVRKDAVGALYNEEADEKHNPIPLDYAAGAEKFPFVKQLDKHTFELVLAKPYPQMLYWMAMNFFAPVAPEAVEFFNQPVLLTRSIRFDRNMVGTGPYKLVEYDPNNRIAFERNENFRSELYPTLPVPPKSDTEAWANYNEMKDAGMLKAAGTPLPMIDRIVFSMEKESVPRWNKFLQGYYDMSLISSDMFDQAVSLTSVGDANVSDEMAARGIRLRTALPKSVDFYAFNMRDDVVGGYTEEKRKLRRAISIAINNEECISVFFNGRALPAQGPIPPGIFGGETGEAGMNPFVYRWDADRDRPARRSLDEAKQLLKEAGYEGGYDKDNKQLTIRYIDRAKTGEQRTMQQCTRKQLEKLNIRVIPENTDQNQFTEKVLEGNYQMLNWGWVADYPDAENYLFLLYGPNAKLVSKGENVPNYESPEYDKLFEQMENMTNGPERLEIIKKMLHVVRRDAPWVFRFHILDYQLNHKWCKNAYPHSLAYNQEKYRLIDVETQREYRKEYNAPIYWPMLAFGLLFVGGTIPAARAAARHFREI